MIYAVYNVAYIVHVSRDFRKLAGALFNQVFTREQLLDHIWGYEYIGDTRTVDVHIKRLREKIKDHPQWSLSTVWGIGYKFEVKNK